MPALSYLLIVKIVLITALIYLAYIDFRSFQLPNAIILPMIASGISFNAFFGLPNHDGSVSLLSSLLGSILGYLLLWFLDQLYYWIKKQHGIGLGDAKLLSALGAWLGIDAVPSILLIASIVGILGGMLWLRHQKLTMRAAFPFGPFLAIAGIIELLWPQYLQSLVLSSPA